MGENAGVNYVNTPEYRTSSGNKNNTNEAHIEVMDNSGNVYESLKKQNVHSEEYDTIKRPVKLENEGLRSRMGTLSLKVTIYILVAVIVTISLLSIAGFAVVLNKVSTLSERIEKNEANVMANTAAVQTKISETVEQNAVSSVKGQKVAFTATGVKGSNPLIFQDIIYNDGDSYNIRSGIFTCSIPGIYYFASTLTKTFGSEIDYVDCHIYVNSKITVGTRQDPYQTEDDKNGYSMSLSGTFHLDAGDTVHIGCDYGSSELYNLYWCSFTGFLVAHGT